MQFQSNPTAAGAVALTLTAVASYFLYKWTFEEFTPPEEELKGVEDKKNESKKTQQKEARKDVNVKERNTSTGEATLTSEIAMKIKQLASNAIRCFKNNEFQQTIELYTEAIDLLEANHGKKNDLRVMLNNRSSAFLELGQHEKVIQDCTRILQIDPLNCKGYQRRASSKLTLKDLSGALADFTSIEMARKHLGQKPDAEIAEQILLLHEQITSREIQDALQNKANATRNLPDDFLIRSFFACFDPAEDPAPEVQESLDALNLRISTVMARLASWEQAEDTEAEEYQQTRCTYGNMLLSRGLQYKKLQNYALAAADFSKCIEYIKATEQYYALAHLEHGTFMYLRRDMAAALEAYQLCLNDEHVSSFATIRIACVYNDKNEIDKAVEEVNKVLATSPNSPTALLHRATFHLKAAKYSYAAKDLTKCIGAAPIFAMAHVKLGIAYINMNKTKQGLASCLKAINLCEKSSGQLLPDMINAVGEAYLAMDKPADAMKQFDKAIELDSKYPLSYVNKGIVMMKMKSLPSSPSIDTILKVFRKAISVSPQCLIAYMCLAKALLEIDQGKDSIRVLDEAFEHAYTEEELHRILGLRLSAEVDMIAEKQLKNESN